MSNIWNKGKALYISYIIIGLAFFLSRLPFFLVPVPNQYYDSLGYFYTAFLFKTGNLSGLGDLPIDIPFGYPIFLYLTDLVNLSNTGIIATQNIIKVIVVLFLIKSVNKYYGKISILVAIAFFFIINDSFSLMLDYMFGTESLYSSSLILTTALLLHVFNSKNKWYFLLFSISLIIPPLIRSNGIYIYFLIFIVLVFFIYFKYAKKYYAYLFLPIIMLNICWALFNYKIGLPALPGNVKRLNFVTERAVEQNNPFGFNGNFLRSKFLFLMAYLNMNQHSKCMDYNFIGNHFIDYDFFYSKADTLYAFKHDFALSDEERSFALKEFYKKSNVIEMTKPHFDIEEKSGDVSSIYEKFTISPKGYFAFSKIVSMYLATPLYKMDIWKLLFLVMLAIASYNIIFRAPDKNDFLILSIILMHLLSLIIISVFHGRVREHYEVVSRFTIYLTIAFLPLVLNFKIGLIRRTKIGN